MGDPLETLISGYWGEVVTPLTETCWSWLPSLPVVSLRNSTQALPSVRTRLEACGYEPVEQEPQATVCQFLGTSVLLLVHPDDHVATWASRETRLFAAQFPVVLGFPPLLGGVPTDLTSVPPVGYGKLALHYARPDPELLSMEHLSEEGVEGYTLLLAIMEHLTIARERHHDPQMFEALSLLFFGQQSKLTSLYAAMARRQLALPTHRRRRLVHHRRHQIGATGQVCN